MSHIHDVPALALVALGPLAVLLVVAVTVLTVDAARRRQRRLRRPAGPCSSIRLLAAERPGRAGHWTVTRPQGRARAGVSGR